MQLWKERSMISLFSMNVRSYSSTHFVSWAIGSMVCIGTVSIASKGLAWVPPDKQPAGLPEVKEPADNPSTAAKISLGKQLFFDKRLSVDNTVSCASCHDPKKGWSNNDATAVGIEGKRGGRSSPTVINSAYSKFQFWEGRAGSLEEQALGPIANPIEMNLPLDQLIEKLKGIEGYRQQFKTVYGTDITTDGVAKSIAAFERTVLSGDAAYDRFKGGDTSALSEKGVKGMKLFFGKANCSSCHAGANFTDNAFHNIGVGMDKPEPDVGRKAISKLLGDTGAFKTPTLRDIAKTAPYMHDGSAATLTDVLNYYNKGGHPNPFLDEEIFTLRLNAEEIESLVEFLSVGLSSSKYPDAEAPELPK